MIDEHLQRGPDSIAVSATKMVGDTSLSHLARVREHRSDGAELGPRHGLGGVLLHVLAVPVPDHVEVIHAEERLGVVL